MAIPRCVWTDVRALNTGRLIAICVVTTVLLAALIATAATTFKRKKMLSENDWKALEFQCVHETFDVRSAGPDAEAWYQQSKSHYSIGMRTERQDLLARHVELLTMAAERGHPKAMNNLVIAYRDGVGVKQNARKAVEWAEKMMEANIGVGFYNMGMFLEQGFGVREDRGASLAYFRRAADLGNRQGQYLVGKKLFTIPPGPEATRVFPIGEAMLRCALEQGEADAGFELALQYQSRKKDWWQAAYWHQQAGKLGHRIALSALHAMFSEGERGAPIDQALAAKYLAVLEQVREDETLQFPNLDTLCPLPPKPGA